VEKLLLGSNARRAARLVLRPSRDDFPRRLKGSYFQRTEPLKGLCFSCHNSCSCRRLSGISPHKEAAGENYRWQDLRTWSVHGLLQKVILPARDVVLFSNSYDEYSAKARPEGRSFVFGGSWTLKIPKPAAPKKPQRDA
jgi:hypothetical protein